MLEIEFVIGQRGHGNIKVLDTHPGVKAQALRHVSILTDHLCKARVSELVINVPRPEAYVLHKMIIQPQRGIKALKDQRSIERLMKYVDQAVLSEIFQSLSQNEKKSVKKYAETHNLSLDLKE